jgi:hypothetical protein
VTYSREQVSAAINRACDDINAAAELPDEGVIDALNLLVNAAMTYLEAPDANLDDVIAGNYQLDEGGDGPLEWIGRA